MASGPRAVYALEKGPRVQLQLAAPEQFIQVYNIPLNGDRLTVNQFITRALNKDRNFFTYDASNTNTCQSFVENAIDANNLTRNIVDEAALLALKPQNTAALVAALGPYRGMSKMITDVAGHVDKLIHDKKITWTPRKPRQIVNKWFVNWAEDLLKPPSIPQILTYFFKMLNVAVCFSEIFLITETRLRAVDHVTSIKHTNRMHKATTFARFYPSKAKFFKRRPQQMTEIDVTRSWSLNWIRRIDQWEFARSLARRMRREPCYYLLLLFSWWSKWSRRICFGLCGWSLLATVFFLLLQLLHSRNQQESMSSKWCLDHLVTSSHRFFLSFIY